MKLAIGMTCLFKDGRHQNFHPDDVEDAMANGWYDTPTEKAPKKRGRKPKAPEVEPEVEVEAEPESAEEAPGEEEV